MLEKCPNIKSEKLDHSDDEETKNLDEIETITYAPRRDSDSSTTSTDSSNSAVSTDSGKSNILEDLSKSLNTLKIEDESDDENLSLENKLKNATNEDFEERAPMGGKRSHREFVHPYQQVNRSVNHQSGGSLVQPPDSNRQASFVDTQHNFLNNTFDDIPTLPDLDEENTIMSILNDPNFNPIFNFLEPYDTSLNFQSDDTTFPDIPTISDQVPIQIFSSPTVSTYSFTTRQSSPAHSDDSSGDHSSLLSPQSYASADTEPVGSPDLPTTLPGSSASTTSDEEEDKNEQATVEVRRLIDTRFFTDKKNEWVRASSQEVEDLISELKQLLRSNTPYSNRFLVRIYAVIHSLLKRDKNSLLKLFTNTPDIIYAVASKNHTLLLRYILETMQNLGLQLQTVGESPIHILLKLLDKDQDMREVIRVLLELRSPNNEVIFSLSERDRHGLTFIHHIFLKMQAYDKRQMRSSYAAYLQMSLDFNPDLTLLDLHNKKTYLHYAVESGCDSYIIDLILRRATALNGIFNIVNAIDADGVSALRMVSNLTEGRKEIEEVFRRYNLLEDDWFFNLHQSNENYLDIF